MRTIGILTFHDSDNFGSVLQAYALCTFLRENGFDVKIIDYRKKEVKKLYSIFKPPVNRHNFLENIYSFFYYKQLRERKKNYESFRQKNIHLSENSYFHNEELKKCSYDIYIVGSDQIWNTSIVDFDTTYLLDFTEKRKISYAASFGPNLREITNVSLFRRELKKFEMITVREQAAVELCADKFNVNAQVVCDPVLLLNEKKWSDIEKEVPKLPPKYVLCYFAGGVSKALDSYSKRKAKELRCDRILIMPDWHDWKSKGKRLYSTGPEEFVYLIKNAEFVCTNSFHGSAFSVIFNKNFTVDDSYADERINTLLNMSGKNSAKLSNIQYLSGEKEKTNNLLNKFIKQSKDYLFKALEE